MGSNNRARRAKTEACRMVDRCQILGLAKLFFVLFCFLFFFTKMLLSELIFGPNEASWTGFWLIYRLRIWKLWSKSWEILWFLIKMGVLWNWKMLKRGLVEQLRERRKGFFPVAHPRRPLTLFKVSTLWVFHCHFWQTFMRWLVFWNLCMIYIVKWRTKLKCLTDWVGFW